MIRSCAGWTAAALGEKLGVKRQTISTIEQGEDKYKMTRMQYLAIRKVLDDEIAGSKDDTQMLHIILDDGQHDVAREVANTARGILNLLGKLKI